MITIKTLEDFKTYCSRAFMLTFKIDITEEEQEELEQLVQAIELYKNNNRLD
jgi:hypothetical protein